MRKPVWISLLFCFVLTGTTCSKPAANQTIKTSQETTAAAPQPQPPVSGPAEKPSVDVTKGSAPQHEAIAPVAPVRKPPVKKQPQVTPPTAAPPAVVASAPAEPSPAPPPESASTPAPVPVPVPAAPTTQQVKIPAGTEVAVRTIDSVDSRTDHEGQTFRASIASDVAVGNQVIVPKGAEAYLKLTRVTSAGELRGKSELQLQLDRIIIGQKSYAVESNIVERSTAAEGPKTARDVAIGAAIGAIIGAISGGGKGAAIGAGAGAGAGVAVAAITKGEQVLVPSETRLDFRLDRELDIEVPVVPPRPAIESLSSSGPKRLGEDESRPLSENDHDHIASLSGKWLLTIEGFQGARTLRMLLEQDGNKLTGTIGSGTADETRVRGRVDRESVSFSGESVVPGRIIWSDYTGTIIGSRLRGTVTTRVTGGDYGIRRRPGGRRPRGRWPGDRRAETRVLNWSAKRVEP
jgi:hypothetical protein